jgi:zinc protease
LGLADFTAAALMRGTSRRNFQEIYEDLESVGASLGFQASTHTAGFTGRALVEDLDLSLTLVAEALRSPSFPAGQIERLRAQLLTGLALRAQNTGEMASLIFDQIVYDGHPYSRPEDGYPETVSRIIREDLVAFHQKHYGPEGLVIVIVGAVEPAHAFEKVERVLGDWQNPKQVRPPELPPLSPLQGTVRRAVEVPGKSQADLLLGVAGPPRRSPDFIPGTLGNNVLGQFGMYGRIGEAVRERAGLAYYVYSSLSGGIGPGSWHVAAGVDPANVEEAMDLIRQEIARFVDVPVSAEELEDTQTNFIGRLPLALESNGGVASALINLERYDLGLDYYRQYAERIQTITPEMILETARHYLDPDRLGIAVAGP